MIQEKSPLINVAKTVVLDFPSYEKLKALAEATQEQIEETVKKEVEEKTTGKATLRIELRQTNGGYNQIIDAVKLDNVQLSCYSSDYEKQIAVGEISDEVTKLLRKWFQEEYGDINLLKSRLKESYKTRNNIICGLCAGSLVGALISLLCWTIFV